MGRGSILLLILFFALPLAGEGRRDDSGSPTSLDDVTMLLTYIEGEVTLDGETAELGQTVQTGTVVSTGTNSYCEIRFAAGNIFRIESNTITELNIGPGQGDIRLEQGSMALLLEKLEVLGIGDKPFSLSTPIIAAGIRGTAFYVKVESEESVYFCCCNGTIDLKDSKGGNPLSLESERHQAVRYTLESDIISQTSAPLLYHDDEYMDHLADEIGYAIPWGSYKSTY